MAVTNKKIYDEDVESAKVKLDGATEALDAMNYDSFKQGSMYGGLKKSYEQQAQRAMKDTLGQIAARTGGMASSYATTAAQQSYNNYMSQLEDVARSMYNDEYSRARDKVSLAQSEYDRLYGEKRDAVADQRYEDEWAYQQSRDALSDQRYEDEWAYQQSRDSIADQRYEDEEEKKAINDEKQSGALVSSIINSVSHELDSDEQKTFDLVYGKRAYESVQRFIQLINRAKNETDYNAAMEALARNGVKISEEQAVNIALSCRPYLFIELAGDSQTTPYAEWFRSQLNQ